MEEKACGALGAWVSDAFYASYAMYICFYEDWCGREDVEESIERVERLVEAVKRVVCGS